MDLALGIILLIAAVFLIVAVLMQNGKAHKMPGTIAGGAETFFGKTKGSTIDRVLSKVTSVVAVAFCIVVVLMYMFQEDIDTDALIDASQSTDTSAVEDTVVDDTSADDTTAADDTSADDTTAAEDTAAAE